MKQSSHIRSLINSSIILYFFPFFNGFYNKYLIENLQLFWFFDFIGYVILPGFVFYFLFSRSILKLSCIGIMLPINIVEWVKFVLHTIFFIVIFYLIYNLLSHIFIHLYPNKGIFYYNLILSSNLKRRFLEASYLSITASVVEEIYFRGLLVKLFDYYKIKMFLSVLIISILFAIIHWETGIANILATFFLSIMVTFYYIQFRMLIPIIIAHFVTDFIIFLP